MKRRLLISALCLCVPIVLLVWMRNVRSWQPHAFGDFGQVSEPLFAPRGSLLAMHNYIYSLQRDQTGFQVWDRSTNRRLWSDVGVYRAVFSPDATLIACDEGARVTVREADTGKINLTLKWPYLRRNKYLHYVSDQNAVVGWTLDGKGLFVRVNWRSLCLYSAQTGKLLRAHTFPLYHATQMMALAHIPHNGWFRRIEWFCLAPEGRTLWAVVGFWKNKDGMVDSANTTGSTSTRNPILTPQRLELWECGTNGRLHHPVGLSNYGVIPNTMLSTRYPGFAISRPYSHPSISAQTHTSAPRRWLAVVDKAFLRYEPFTPSCITLWEMTTGQRHHTLNLPGDVADLQFSLDAKTLFVSVRRGNTSNSHEVRIYDVASGRLTRTLAPWCPGDSTRLELTPSPDGTTLATAAQDFESTHLQIWRLK